MGRFLSGQEKLNLRNAASNTTRNTKRTDLRLFWPTLKTFHDSMPDLSRTGVCLCPFLDKAICCLWRMDTQTADVSGLVGSIVGEDIMKSYTIILWRPLPTQLKVFRSRNGTFISKVPLKLLCSQGKFSCRGKAVFHKQIQHHESWDAAWTIWI